MTAFAIPVPPGWTVRPASGEELLRADRAGAWMRAELVPLTDPREAIPQQVRAAAGGEAPVATSYLDVPAGRAILAHAAAQRTAAQLWLPLPGGEALVITVVAESTARGDAVAQLARQIGARLRRDETRGRGPAAGSGPAAGNAPGPGSGPAAGSGPGPGSGPAAGRCITSRKHGLGGGLPTVVGSDA